MGLENYLDMTVRELLDNYGLVYNLECCYPYGVADYDNIDEIFNKYNVDDEYPEAFSVEPVIDIQVLDCLDDGELSYQKMVKIMGNLDISEKKDVDSKK